MASAKCAAGAGTPWESSSTTRHDMTTRSLFDDPTEPLAPGAVVLRGFAEGLAGELLADLQPVIGQAPLRHMVTPGGFRMSVAMTNCGAWGWVAEPSGYRYDAIDPLSGRPWPPMPDSFRRLAGRAAARAGFDDFVPDACLVNRYEPG